MIKEIVRLERVSEADRFLLKIKGCKYFRSGDSNQAGVGGNEIFYC
jgi:hypothetical protein